MTTMTSKPKTKKRYRYPTPKVRVVNRRAVEVALDAMKQARYLRLRQGIYLMVGHDAREAVIESGAKDLQEVVEKVAKDCSCCALGACLLSKARLYDEVPLDIDEPGWRWNAPNSHFDVYKTLRDVFGNKQCGLIEAAFECDGSYAQHVGNSSAASKAAAGFGQRRGNAHKLFLAIMRNIVENGGVFRPEQE